MPDPEKVIKGLEMLIGTYGCRDVYYMDCKSCVYNGDPHCVDSILGDAISLLKAQESVVPHRNYQYLSDYWCECGWHLGRRGSLKYCPECGRAVKWDG